LELLVRFWFWFWFQFQYHFFHFHFHFHFFFRFRARIGWVFFCSLSHSQMRTGIAGTTTTKVATTRSTTPSRASSTNSLRPTATLTWHAIILFFLFYFLSSFFPLYAISPSCLSWILIARIPISLVCDARMAPTRSPSRQRLCEEATDCCKRRWRTKPTMCFRILEIALCLWSDIRRLWIETACRRKRFSVRMYISRFALISINCFARNYSLCYVQWLDKCCIVGYSWIIICVNASIKLIRYAFGCLYLICPSSVFMNCLVL
jgi:hypothetical protein